MKITYLHQYFALPTSTSGTRSYEFAKRLAAVGYEVTVITSTASLPDPYRNVSKVKTFDIEGVRVTVIPQPYNNSMGYATRIRAFISFALWSSFLTVRQPTDLIFATSTPLTIALPAIAGRIWHRKPIVFEVRDLWPEVPIALGALKNPILYRFSRWLEWLAYHSANQIVALSPGMAKGISKRGIPDQRITVIPNSCDVDLFQKNNENADWVRKRLNLTPDQTLIVYTGTFGLVNGLSYAVEIAARVLEIDPTIHFLLVGEGREKEEIQEKAEKMGILDRNVSIWPPLPKVEIVKIVATATIVTSFVIPVKELENNSANKFFDGLAAGKPVIINHEGWQKEILEESGAGISISANDPSEAALQIVEFAADKERLQKAAEAAKKLATSRFNRDVLFTHFEEVIRKALKSPNTHTGNSH